MEPSWRKFEALVARIEETLAPKGAMVVSPDHIKDMITGQMREVDASIRYTVGSVPILITVECRERRSVQDDTWIEQLATKKNKIGAAKTIAVSSTGFTKPAIESARHHNIELRRINDITDDEIAGKWAEGVIVELHLTNYTFTLLRIHFDTDKNSDGLQISSEISNSFLKDPLSTVVLYVTETNKPLTINDILVAHTDTSNIVPGEPMTDEKFSLDFPKGTYFSYSSAGRYDVLGIDIEFGVSASTVKVPFEEINQGNA